MIVTLSALPYNFPSFATISQEPQLYPPTPTYLCCIGSEAPQFNAGKLRSFCSSEIWAHYLDPAHELC